MPIAQNKELHQELVATKLELREHVEKLMQQFEFLIGEVAESQGTYFTRSNSEAQQERRGGSRHHGQDLSEVNFRDLAPERNGVVGDKPEGAAKKKAKEDHATARGGNHLTQ